MGPGKGEDDDQGPTTDGLTAQSLLEDLVITISGKTKFKLSLMLNS
jgi:hypothetical protein